LPRRDIKLFGRADNPSTPDFFNLMVRFMVYFLYFNNGQVYGSYFNNGQAYGLFFKWSGLWFDDAKI
jgi:hypothetical protein